MLGSRSWTDLANVSIVGEDFVGRAAGGDVVVAGVEDDRARFVFEDDAVGEVVDVGDRRAAEAAVDDGQVGEGVGRLPEADRGAADEEDAVFAGRRFGGPTFRRRRFRFRSARGRSASSRQGAVASFANAAEFVGHEKAQKSTKRKS